MYILFYHSFIHKGFNMELLIIILMFVACGLYVYASLQNYKIENLISYTEFLGEEILALKKEKK